MAYRIAIPAWQCPRAQNSDLQEYLNVVIVYLLNRIPIKFEQIYF